MRGPIIPPAEFVGRLLPQQGELSAKRRAWIMAKRKQGYSYQEIADATALTLHRIYDLTRPRWKNQQRHRHADFAASHFTGALPPEVHSWLRKSKPEGVTMGAFVASIVTDAHAEETDASNV